MGPLSKIITLIFSLILVICIVEGISDKNQFYLVISSIVFGAFQGWIAFRWLGIHGVGVIGGKAGLSKGWGIEISYILGGILGLGLLTVIQSLSLSTLVVSITKTVIGFFSGIKLF